MNPQSLIRKRTLNHVAKLATGKRLATIKHSYWYLVGNFLVLRRPSRALRNFPIFLALDCPQVLGVLRNRLKFHIDIKQGLKNLLNGFLDLSSY